MSKDSKEIIIIPEKKAKLSKCPKWMEDRMYNLFLKKWPTEKIAKHLMCGIRTVQRVKIRNNWDELVRVEATKKFDKIRIESDKVYEHMFSTQKRDVLETDRELIVTRNNYINLNNDLVTMTSDLLKEKKDEDGEIIPIDWVKIEKMEARVDARRVKFERAYARARAATKEMIELVGDPPVKMLKVAEIAQWRNDNPTPSNITNINNQNANQVNNEVKGVEDGVQEQMDYLHRLPEDVQDAYLNALEAIEDIKDVKEEKKDE